MYSIKTTCCYYIPPIIIMQYFIINIHIYFFIYLINLLLLGILNINIIPIYYFNQGGKKMNNTMTNVKELNAFLKGEYMAVDSYEHFIRIASSKDVKNLLQDIQNDHKDHAIAVSDRINVLGGEPVTGVGISGKAAELFSNLKHMNHNQDMDILKEALSGESKGIEMAEEIVKGDLDFQSAALISNILTVDKKHLSRLEKSITH
jgi:bacterioferritin